MALRFDYALRLECVLARDQVHRAKSRSSNTKKANHELTNNEFRETELTFLNGL